MSRWRSSPANLSAPSSPRPFPSAIATAAAELMDGKPRTTCDRERDLLHRLMVDGELIILDDGMVVPADGYEPVR